MQTGTSIVAARSGTVIEVVRSFGMGENREEFRPNANFVRVLHHDGTWAEYAHLLQYTSNLSPGQWIEAGTPIGLSGNSGYTSGPHLHFVVQRNDGTQTVSVPFSFTNRALRAFSPRSHMQVTADYAASSSSDVVLSGAAAKMPKIRSLSNCMGEKKHVGSEVIHCMNGPR
jgi:murein DD-endopeptidase MepM/ murein hydrolase activator NlpD